MRGATIEKTNRRGTSIFQSTLLMRGATSLANPCPCVADISIHAPHARSDKKAVVNAYYQFDFNPRSSCEERLSSTHFNHSLPVISIHAPHARSDCLAHYMSPYDKGFQSTLLMRGATSVLRFSPVVAVFQSTLLMRGATSPVNPCAVRV